ncbi:MAG: hypothetical protein AAFR07_14430 [Pseudomonadota bacterium]
MTRLKLRFSLLSLAAALLIGTGLIIATRPSSEASSEFKTLALRATDGASLTEQEMSVLLDGIYERAAMRIGLDLEQVLKQARSRFDASPYQSNPKPDDLFAQLRHPIVMGVVRDHACTEHAMVDPNASQNSANRVFGGASGKCIGIVYELIDSVVADAVGEGYRGLGALSDYFH